MATNISWKLNLEIQSGPNIIVTNAIQADAYDRIEVKVPDTTASPTATTVDVQPGAAGKIKLLLIRSTKYGDNLKEALNKCVLLVAPINRPGLPAEKGRFPLPNWRPRSAFFPPFAPGFPGRCTD